jgi:hypothetical protein
MKTYKHSYAELARIGNKYHNDTNFCSLVATCVATGQPFSKVFRAYKEEGRVTGTGTTRLHQGSILQGFGKKMEIDGHKTRAYKTLVGVASDCHTWGEGTYWIYVRGHVAAVRDGILEDWSAVRKYRGRVIDIWKIEEVKK